MVTTELRGEKVDIVPFSDDPAEFVSRALQPAKVKEVLLDEERGRATVIVHDYQLSLAIGKEGQNARLAARLTGWHIDIKSESEAAAEEADYAEGEWAEGEWVEESGEMVWKPAEGGESLSAEAWAAGETSEAEEAALEAAVEAAEGLAEAAEVVEAAEELAEAVEAIEELAEAVEAIEALEELAEAVEAVEELEELAEAIEELEKLEAVAGEAAGEPVVDNIPPAVSAGDRAAEGEPGA